MAKILTRIREKGAEIYLPGLICMRAVFAWFEHGDREGCAAGLKKRSRRRVLMAYCPPS